MSIHYKITGDNEDFKRKMRENSKIIRDGANEAEKVSSGIDKSVKAIGGAVAALFTAQQASRFIRSMVQIRGEFQQLEIAFTTMLKSGEKADKLMADLTKLQEKLPLGYSLQLMQQDS